MAKLPWARVTSNTPTLIFSKTKAAQRTQKTYTAALLQIFELLSTAK